MINVDLKNQANSLNEVVVTALGIRKEAKRLGYSTQTCQVLQVVHPTSVTVSKALTRMI
jgi:predicted nucleic acid-binding protein